jgi:iron complex outermembrane receptor protein
MRPTSLGAALILWSCTTPLLAQEPPPPADESPGATESVAPADAPASPQAAAPVETIPVPQPPPPAGTVTEDKSAPTALDTIEVTATRRKERLIDVPVAVTAITEDQVEARRIERIDDLNSIAPGLQVSRSPSNTTISQITIRGSSQINPALYWDPAVGVYLDGVYIGKSQGAIFDVVDIAGVEVLRGPQGTLYGRNTIGGTINVITKEPTGIFSGSAGVEYGNFNDRVGRASIDLPRLGFANISIGARSERRDGWVKTLPGSSAPELNDRNNDGAHIAVAMDPLDSLSAIYRFDWNRVDQTNTFDQLYRSDDPTLASYVHKDRQTDNVSVDAPSFERFKLQGHALTLTWNLSDRDAIKSISAYRKVTWADSLDLDGSPQFVAFTQRFTDYDQKSQDLNLTGRTDRWKYVVGAFGFVDDGFTNNPQHFYSGALNFDSRYGTHTRALAGYGQADWNLLDPLTITAGVRYTREKKRLDRTLGVSPLGALPIPAEVLALLPPAAANGYVYYIPDGYSTPEATFSATTPMASVAWKFSDTLNTYLRYAQGFKSGGFNGEFSSLTDTPQANQDETSTPFRPEKQKSLELGVKSSFFSGRALANVAAFHNKLDDLQVSIFTAQGAASSTIRNAGKATVDGIEIETALEPFEGTQLRANYAYLKARYDEFIDEGGNQASNRAFVHAPKNAYNLVLDSTFLDGAWGALRAVVDYAWTDSFYTYPYQLGPDQHAPGMAKQEAENTRVKAYGLLNARLSWGSIPFGRIANGELALWGRNLADNATADNFIDFGPGAFMNLTVANFVEPRSFGVSGVFRW